MTVYKRAVELLEAEFGDEMVALEPHAGKCFGFNSAAAFVWRALRQPRTFDELRLALLREYDVTPNQCASDLAELLTEMCDRGLVTQT